MQAIPQSMEQHQRVDADDDPGCSMLVPREEFCLDEAKRTMNLAIQQEADEKGALLMMNDDGTMRMVEPLHSSFVGGAQPGVMRNGGNTCYMSAVIFAMFARLDAWDVLLVHQLSSCEQTAMQDHLREAVVNPVRRAEAVPGHQMCRLSLIHISEPTRLLRSRMPSSA
eukprot:TRINITY_DN39676_c0_g1_i1.p1 TRINITY_DN39676_c0_g1~~TRINITY_DN39676_c0_g1_i1.p1  ORF type:complete len:168 (-),score=42.27 TRINITY_DN39676_c0_g1_i1:113-616(-)